MISQTDIDNYLTLFKRPDVSSIDSYLVGQKPGSNDVPVLVYALLTYYNQIDPYSIQMEVTAWLYKAIRQVYLGFCILDDAHKDAFFVFLNRCNPDNFQIECFKYIHANEFDLLNTYIDYLCENEMLTNQEFVAMIDKAVQFSYVLNKQIAAELRLWLFNNINQEQVLDAKLYQTFIDEYIYDVRSGEAIHPKDISRYYLDLNPYSNAIEVVNRGLCNLKEDPGFIEIDNFRNGKIVFYFLNSACMYVAYGENRPWSEHKLPQCDQSLQYRHIIGVQWIKDLIRSVVSERDIEDLIISIRDARSSLLSLLNITSLPVFPSFTIKTEEDAQDYAVSLAYYEYEMEQIQTKADQIKLTAIQQLAILCRGFDDFCTNTYVRLPEIDQQKYFAHGIALLYRDMIYNSHNIFVGSREVNERLGQLTGLLKKHLNSRVFPVHIPVWKTKNNKFQNIRNYLFNDTTSNKKQEIIVDSEDMLLDLYFAAQYDREIEVSPRVSNAISLFFHTYDVEKTSNENDTVNPNSKMRAY